jgi:hypothetical protein
LVISELSYGSSNLLGLKSQAGHLVHRMKGAMFLDLSEGAR